MKPLTYGFTMNNKSYVDRLLDDRKKEKFNQSMASVDAISAEYKLNLNRDNIGVLMEHDDSKYSPDMLKFALHLLSKSDRIKLVTIGDEDEGVGYIPKKNNIIIGVALRFRHEVAHLVEISHSRLTLPDFGLPLTPSSKKGIFSGLARETRVRAIQSHMQDKKISILDNKYWVDSIKKNLPFGKFNSFNEVKDWIDVMHQTIYDAWSLDRIEHEWISRMNYLHEWMETS